MESGHARSILAEVAGWATPNAMDATRGSAETDADKLARGANPGQSLIDQASLAGWATPKAEDAESSGIRHGRGVADTLTAQAMIQGWTTPTAHDASPISATQKAKHGTKHGCSDLNHDAAKAIGTDTNSSTSPTVAKGALNPALSRWLQGYPKEWCKAAIRAFRSIPKRPRRRA